MVMHYHIVLGFCSSNLRKFWSFSQQNHHFVSWPSQHDYSHFLLIMSSPLILNGDDDDDVDMQPTQLYIPSYDKDGDGEDEDDMATQVDPVYVFKLELFGDSELVRQCQSNNVIPDSDGTNDGSVLRWCSC